MIRPLVRSAVREQAVDALQRRSRRQCRSRRSRSSCPDRCRWSWAPRPTATPPRTGGDRLPSDPSPPTVISASIRRSCEAGKQLIGSIHFDPGAVVLLHRKRDRVATVRRAQDRAALVQDATNPLAGELDQPAIGILIGEQQSVVTRHGSPRHPSRGCRAAKVAARITALSPGASPPPVLIAIRLITGVTNETLRNNSCRHQVQIGRRLGPVPPATTTLTQWSLCRMHKT